MSGVTVLQAGICDTVQDRGRFGLLAQGFSPSGAMDQRSAFIANALVGNDASCAVLEYAYLGPVLRFDQRALICLTGAPFSTTLGGEVLLPYCAHRVEAGAVLHIGRARAGAYGYLAVAGGIAVEPVLGSRSTSLRYGIGRRLQAGDHLPLAEAQPVGGGALASRDAYFRWDAPAPHPLCVRTVTPGPCGGADSGWTSLFEQPFVVDAASDRMGVRLRGQGRGGPVAPASDLVSEALALGTVQVPASGNPIVAMADRQTTGGYRKAGVVAGVDLPLLAQCRPGTLVRFEPVCVATAQRMLRRDAAFLCKLARQLRERLQW